MDSGFDRTQALLVSFGTGVTNWLFAIPALYTIDTFGRRNLLLTTFPLMGCCLLFTGFSFFVPEGQTRLGMVAAGIYLFMVVYSPGEGPVPFTYSAEAFPLYIRDIGMSFATATCWGFNFILSFTWLALVRAFQPQGAFAFYAAWNFAAFFICYFFLPETKVCGYCLLSLFLSVSSFSEERLTILGSFETNMPSSLEPHSRRTRRRLQRRRPRARQILPRKGSLVHQQACLAPRRRACCSLVPIPRLENRLDQSGVHSTPRCSSTPCTIDDFSSSRNDGLATGRAR